MTIPFSTPRGVPVMLVMSLGGVSSRIKWIKTDERMHYFEMKIIYARDAVDIGINIGQLIYAEKMRQFEQQENK